MKRLYTVLFVIISLICISCLFFFFNLVFKDRVSVCILAVLELALLPGWPQTQRSTAIAGIKYMYHHCPALNVVFLKVT